MAKIQFFAKAGKQTVVYESSSDIPDNYLEMIYFGWQFEKWQVRAIRSVEKELKREVSDDIKSEWPAAFRTSKSGWADKMIEGLRISKRIGKRGDVVYGKVHVMGVRQRGKSTNKGDKSGSFRLRFFEGGAKRKKHGTIDPHLWLNRRAKSFDITGRIKLYLNTYMKEKGLIS
jgi:hypothetical protein